MNQIIVSGNLTKEPEVRYTKSGISYARTAIAVNRPFSKEKATDFFNLTAWRNTADFFGRYLHKGSKILVVGRLQNSNYEKDGVKHYGNEIIVDGVEFMDSKKKSEETADNFEGEPLNDDDVPF